MLFAQWHLVRVLEAHFHPASRGSPVASFIIARIYCDGDRVSVEPVVSAIEHSAPIRKLRYIVGRAGPDPFARLQRLRSDYWSFAAPKDAPCERERARPFVERSGVFIALILLVLTILAGGLALGMPTADRTAALSFELD